MTLAIFGQQQQQTGESQRQVPQRQEVSEPPPPIVHPEPGVSHGYVALRTRIGVGVSAASSIPNVSQIPSAQIQVYFYYCTTAQL